MVSPKTSITVTIVLVIAAVLFIVNDIGFDTTAAIVTTGKPTKPINLQNVWLDLVVLVVVGSLGAALIAQAAAGPTGKHVSIEHPEQELKTEWKTVRVKRMRRSKGGK